MGIVSIISGLVNLSNISTTVNRHCRSDQINKNYQPYRETQKLGAIASVMTLQKMV